MFVVGLLQAVAPVARAAGETPSPTPTGAATPVPAGTPAPTPTATAAVSGSQVPVATMTPATGSRITLILFDEDIVLVGGRGFTAGGDVTVEAQTTKLGGSALTRADADGRFILGFRVPTDFAGDVNVKATQGGATTADALNVVGPEAQAQAFQNAPRPALPNEPVVRPAASATPAPGGATTTPGTTTPGTTTGPSATPAPTATPTPAVAPSPSPSLTLSPTGSPASNPSGATKPGPSTPAVTAAPPAGPTTGPTTAPTAAAGTGGGAAPSTIDTAGSLSGLPWMSGVYPSHQLSQVLEFGTWRGRPNDIAHVFTVRTTGWAGLVEPHWPLDLYKAFQGKLLISEPMFPQGQGDNATCARGEYDAQWKKLGTFLVANGRADSIVRIGWEFNGLFMYWHTDADATNWRTCFQKVSAAIRSTDPQVKIDWTFNAHASPVPSGNSPWSAYPGDQYVDYVGIDSYDQFPPSKDEATWDKQCEDVNGLCYVIKFAREHGKKVGVGEWGVTSCSRNGGGDNPFYIQKMYETFMANRDVMGYDAYFSDAAPGNVCSTIVNGGQNPQASAEYKKLFGGGTS